MQLPSRRWPLRFWSLPEDAPAQALQAVAGELLQQRAQTWRDAFEHLLNVFPMLSEEYFEVFVRNFGPGPLYIYTHFYVCIDISLPPITKLGSYRGSNAGTFRPVSHVAHMCIDYGSLYVYVFDLFLYARRTHF